MGPIGFFRLATVKKSSQITDRSLIRAYATNKDLFIFHFIFLNIEGTAAGLELGKLKKSILFDGYLIFGRLKKSFHKTLRIPAFY